MSIEAIKKEIVSNGKLVKLDSVAIESLSKRLSISTEEVKRLYVEAKAEVKAERAREKLEKFNTENCVFSYQGQSIAFKPVYITIENSLVVIWKTNLDKNAIYYIYENEDSSIVIEATACVSEKSKSFDYRKSLVSGNKKKVKAMLEEMLNGCTFRQFFERASNFKGFREVSISGGLKNIKLSRAKENYELTQHNSALEEKKIA